MAVEVPLGSLQLIRPFCRPLTKFSALPNVGGRALGREHMYHNSSEMPIPGAVARAAAELRHCAPALPFDLLFKTNRFSGYISSYVNHHNFRRMRVPTENRLKNRRLTRSSAVAVMRAQRWVYSYFSGAEQTEAANRLSYLNNTIP